MCTYVDAYECTYVDAYEVFIYNAFLMRGFLFACTRILRGGRRFASPGGPLQILYAYVVHDDTKAGVQHAGVKNWHAGTGTLAKRCVYVHCCVVRVLFTFAIYLQHAHAQL